LNAGSEFVDPDQDKTLANDVQNAKAQEQRNLLILFLSSRVAA
jgi:hypothetical protein